MINTLHTTERWLGKACQFIANIAFLLMLLVSVLDVCSRALFSVSGGRWQLLFSGASDLVMVCLLIALSAALAAHVAHSQIVIDLITRFIPEPVKRRYDAVMLLLWSLVAAVFTWGLIDAAQRTHQHHESTPDLHLPLSWIHASAAVLFCILAVRAALLGIASLCHETTSAHIAEHAERTVDTTAASIQKEVCIPCNAKYRDS